MTDPVKTLKGLLIEKLHLDPMGAGLNVSLIDGSVLIEGVVDRIAQKKRALFIAMNSGFEGVVDRLRLVPSMRMSDAEIQKHIYDAFAGEDTLKDYDLKVEVSDSVVDIEGSVISLSHKRLAGALAWWVPGVMDVINSIELDPPEDDNDDEIRDAVRIILEKDRLVDAASIHVSSKDWVVMLSGVCGSVFERNAAEDDAWFTWGVNEVINRIIIMEESIHELP